MVRAESPCRLISVLSAVLFMTAGIVFVPPVGAEEEEEEGPSWEELKAQYGDRHAAIVLKDHYTITLLFDATPRMSTRFKRRLELAIFDAEKAEEHLTRSVYVWPGYKLRDIKAWSLDAGSRVSGARAKDSDIQEKDLGRGWKELRVAIPGLSRAGYASLEYELQGETHPDLDIDFSNRLHVREGRCVLRVPYSPNAANYAKEYGFERVFDLFAFVPRGKIETIEVEKAKREEATGWQVEDLPPRYTDPRVPARLQPSSQIRIDRSRRSWKTTAEFLFDKLKKIKAPKPLVKAARDTLKGRPPAEIVTALVRFLDDPSSFHVTGNPRYAEIEFRELEDIVQARRGTALDKAVLASRLLKELKVKHSVVLAASKYITDLDWRVYHYSQLTTALIWIPGISENFLWDVGARWVPVGKAGSDLYESMLVLDPKLDQPVMEFPIEDGDYRENRYLRFSLAEDGGLECEVACRFEAFPLAELDPWDVDSDPSLDSSIPAGMTATETRWKDVDWATMRCSPESPAVLTGRFAGEAIPAGETGWEIRPFFMDLPDDLRQLADPSRKAPLLLTRGIEVSDSVFVELNGRKATELPKPINENNRLGRFQCVWEEQDTVVLARRKLTIAPAALSQSQVTWLRSLCRAWEQSAESALLVE